MAAFPTLKQILQIDLPGLEIMDVGAMIEGAERYAPLVGQGLARVTGFEPNPDEYAKLAKRKGPYTYFPVFLGDGADAKFHVTRYPGCASLFEPDAAVIDRFVAFEASQPDGNFYVQKTEVVQTVRLDDVDGCKPPDYVKLDVQGGELAVIQHGAKTLAQALVLEVEVEFIPLYRDQPLYGDIERLLRQRGFVLHKFVDVSGRGLRPIAPANRYLPISQLISADAVFIRNYWDTETLDREQLLKAGLVLHDIYRSYDMVHYLLAAHDSRTRGDLAERYRQFLSSDIPPTFFLNLRASP